ncbi:MAG TPA: hypothetical protein VK203_10640 [Nostocaceae cyanobacterium]|nr:hypothetical protein [Nostocaceae cyanobacterium]
MHQILSIIYPFAHFTISLMELVLIGLSIRFWLRSNSLAMIVLPIVLASLSYDNLVLSMGNLIGEGDLLENLSMLRFLVHYLVLPLFIVVGVELAHRAGAVWANQSVRILSWFVAFGLAGIDIATNFVGLELTPIQFLGILRYKNAAMTSLPIITIVVNLFVLLIGGGIWVRLKWSWLFVGILIALIGNGIPSSIVGTLPGSASEFVMAISLLFTEQRTRLTVKPMPSEEEQLKPESLLSGL